MNGCFIPKKIKVGFQERKDTYSGKLAYVIYYDEKNNLRKEQSWNSWRDKNSLFLLARYFALSPSHKLNTSCR